MDVLSKLHKNHVLLSIKRRARDRREMRGEPETLQSCFAFPYWHFAANGQIASRPSWSVSAARISIGNHSPACFLKVSAHQQQKLCGHSELGLKAFSGLEPFNNKASKEAQEGTERPQSEDRSHLGDLTKTGFLWRLQRLLTGKNRKVVDVWPESQGECCFLRGEPSIWIRVTLYREGPQEKTVSFLQIVVCWGLKDAV